MSMLSFLRPAPAVLAAGAVAAFALSTPATTSAERDEHRPLVASSLGARLYSVHCATCHGVEAKGVTGRGPDLTVEGPAAVDFVLRTGRMPMAEPGMQAQRGPVQFDENEIRALVGYVGSLGNGPAIPAVDVSGADITNGGAIYRLNCAACHVASGAGAPIGGDRQAPSLMESTATQIGEAIRIGPGAMPAFGTLSSAEVNDVAAYILRLQEDKTAGVDSFGGAGPVAEGLAAWLLGLLPLIALTRWIGRPHEGRDRIAVEGPDDVGSGSSAGDTKDTP